jgi:hypothetical protein
MSSSILILLLTTLLLPGCSASQSQSDSWSIQVKTSGGFTGRGNGNVQIDSQGHIIYDKPAIPNKPASPCKGSLSQEDLREIKDAVEHTKPQGWKVAGLDIAAPDAYGYDLKLQIGTESHQVRWYDNTTDQLPGDLKALYNAVSSIKEKQARKCDGQ